MSGFAIAGLVIGVATTAISFADKAKQENRARQAQGKANEMMEKARAKLKINFADALSIAKEPYEREREAMLSAGAQVMEQGVESERGGAATAGRVLAMQQEGQGQIRDQQSQDIFNLEAMQAEEDSRLRDINVQMDLGEVAGAQQAAAEAENAANVAKGQAIQGVGQVAQSAVSMGALYSKDGATRATNKMARQAKRAGVDYNTPITTSTATTKTEAKGFAGTAAVKGVGVPTDKNYVQGVAYVAPGSDYIAPKEMYAWGANGENQVDITGLKAATSANQRKDWWNQQDEEFIKWYRQNIVNNN